jgi:dolichol-phosphate mannosyltransferase
VLLTMPVPLVRMATGRADAVDLAALAVRLGTLFGTRRAFDRGGLAYWTSPLADLVAGGVLAAGIVRPHRTWRGRRYR